MKETILIIDDNVKWCKSLAQNFAHRGYQTVYATSGKEAFSILSQESVTVSLLDIMLGEENGLEVLKEIVRVHQRLPVIMITGFGSIDTAVQSIKLGAFDYVTKPLDFDRLLKIVENAVTMAHLAKEVSYRKVKGEVAPNLITQDATMLTLCAKAKKFAATDLPILVTGENGTGKEIIADFIHAHSPRNAHQMLKINCAAFPETLLDNELFGHEKGAYTGADKTFQGVFERAHDSSLFLDEIGDMPLTIQAKILRALQNHEIRRLGGAHTIQVNVRFITATNKDVQELLRKNLFREDLFYRLNTATIPLPPLHDRKDDIPLLAEYFLAEYAEMHAAAVKRLSDAAIAQLSLYNWPGNIRELRNTINYAATIAAADIIEIEDLPPHFKHFQPPKVVNNIREDMECKLIIETLRSTNYNKRKTAELLNMSRNTLYSKLEKYGIATPK